ncbi:paramyosin-like isoform X2 [Varroa jacobsoni]|uniref:paramyosin-like isoform X2 n=1 Tax=Varroa jacobsoni TaxID=62625 RepID=UPI000BF72732|nr:paramyosin-like isoform X2 [Varroa jacobsoni]
MQPNSTPNSKFGRLRGIPSHLEEAIAELENSLASPEGGERAGASPLAMILHGMDTATDSNLANQLRLFTQRLSEFVTQSRSNAEAEAEALCQERQKNVIEAEKAAKEVALAKLRTEESQLQLESVHEEVAFLKADLENERARIIQLEKNIVEIKHQAGVRVKEIEALEARLKKTEDARAAFKEQRDVLTVKLAVEQGRLVAVTAALEASERSAQHRRSTAFGEHLLPARTSTPPITNCTPTCHQIRQDLAELRAVNEQLRRELTGCQERAVRQREASNANERRLHDQLNRARKLVSQERSRAEKLAYLHAALASDRRNAADLITTLQGQLTQLLYDNQRQPRGKQQASSSCQSFQKTEPQDESSEKSDPQGNRQQDAQDELEEDTLVRAPSVENLSCRENELGQQETQLRRRHSIPPNLQQAATENCPTM